MPLYNPTQPLLVQRAFRGARKYKTNEPFDPADAKNDADTIEGLISAGYLRHGTPETAIPNELDEQEKIARFEEKALTMSAMQARKKREAAEAARAAKVPQIPRG